MLALIKKPRIELSLHGEHASELVEWIRKKYDLDILSEVEATDEEYVPTPKAPNTGRRWRRIASATCLPARV